MKTFSITTLILLCLCSVSKAQVSFGNSSLWNEGWLFTLADDSLASHSDYPADATWRQVTLPHDWSIEATPSPDLASCTGYLPGGIGWYRKHFTLQRNPSRKQYIYFEGVYNRSEVYLNGHLLGRRPSGFASFCYDMTPYLTDGDNVIAVRVDHSRHADSRWYTGSGIYRDVWLIDSHRDHLTQWGTGYVCTSLTDDEATIEVETSYDGVIEKQVSINAQLRDANGKVVAKANNILVGLPDRKVKFELKVQNPKRWDLDSPYLYTLHVELIRNLSKVDETDVTVGLRQLEFNADKGFALNGRWMKVKGVCLHHDAGILGAVVPEDVWRRRLTALKAIGANAIRCAHNPQAPVLYDLCDQLGLLVMDEASDEWEFPKRKWVKGWNVGEPSFDGTYDFFEEWIDRDVTDMVRRDRNHPSIILWSIGNEVDYPNDPYSHPVLNGKDSAFSQPIFGGYDPKRPNAERIGKIARRLATCVRNVDTSRPVTGALAGVVMSNETEYPDAVDVVGYNYTEKRYDTDHATYPTRIIYGSENGVGYDAWCAVRDKEFIFGQFIWTGTDYLGESGKWPSRGLHTGLLDFGSFPKPRGHFRAALWCDNPVCYIGTYIDRPRRNDQRGHQLRLSAEAFDTWNYNHNQRVRVVCYTNQPQARLMLNGKQVGELRKPDPKSGIIHWDVDYQPGHLMAEACDNDGKAVTSYCIHTSTDASSLQATVDVERLPAGQSHVAHVIIEVTDKDGHIVKDARNAVTCHVEGPARLLGLENSDNSDMGNLHTDTQHVFHGRLLAYIQTTGKEGTVTLRLTSPGLKDTSVKIKVKP
ncbi:MAG: DUF4982 domain-containing protein [Bacteroidales bacterium]|nr:DUF4982 domain-containing protein [Candidatus Liminaster caballi]